MKISIITVTYNSENFIVDCLESIKSQTHKDIEHIVIDGASTDNTISLLKSKQDKLTTLVSEIDDGIYDAMNKGIMLAKGDIIGFLNSDDLYINNKVILKVVNLFKERPEIEACYSDLAYVDKINTSKIIRYWKSSDFILGSFSKGWCPPHPTFFVRRSIYERFGHFDISFRFASDIELMMRFLEIYKINSLYVPDMWIKMRMGGITNKNLKNIWTQNREILRALNKHNLSANPINFFSKKIISRCNQYLNK